MEMIELSSFMARILIGTDYSIPVSIIDALPDLIQKTYLPAIYHGEMMYMFMGRSTSVDPFQNAAHILLDCYTTSCLITDATTRDNIVASCRNSIQPLAYTATVFGGMSPMRDKPVYNNLMGESSTNSSDDLFALFYPCGDRLIFQTPRFRFGLSMSSARIGKFESINNMNTTGWYLGDGMTYLYLPTDREQYVGYFNASNLNWYRLPGTTVDVMKRNAETGNYGLFGIPNNQTNWVGGLHFRGIYAQAGMHLQSQISSLNAKKSWFCFTEEIVCLGAGISMTEQRKAESIIENRKSKLAITIDGQARENKKGVELSHVNPSYMHLEGTGGYYFPDTTQTVYSFCNYDGYSMIYFSHGVAPQDASYSYVLLPGMSLETTADYAAQPAIRVLSNDTSVQAVLHVPTNVVGINFWNANAIYGVSSDGPASIMLQQEEKDLFIAISEPTWKRTSQVITLDGDFRLRDTSVPGIAAVNSDGTNTTISINTTDRLGQPVELQLRGVLNPESIDNVPEDVQHSHPKVEKVISNGYFRIRINSRTYNALGQCVE